LEIYGPFAAIERVMMALARAGADRQEMHERLRGHAMTAWEAVQQGRPNPLVELVSRDEALLSYLNKDELLQKMNAQGHLGDAPTRARKMAGSIREILA